MARLSDAVRAQVHANLGIKRERLVEDDDRHPIVGILPTGQRIELTGRICPTDKARWLERWADDVGSQTTARLPSGGAVDLGGLVAVA